MLLIDLLSQRKRPNTSRVREKMLSASRQIMSPYPRTPSYIRRGPTYPPLPMGEARYIKGEGGKAGAFPTL
jgi:hypothetical protein